MKFVEEEEVGDLPSGQKQISTKPARAIKEYLSASADLLRTKYNYLADIAPSYLSDPGNVIVARCTDGFVIRYEKKIEHYRVFAISTETGIDEAALMLSQGLVRCIPEGATSTAEEPKGIEIRLSIRDPEGNPKKDIGAVKVLFEAVMKRPNQPAAPSQKPYCLLSAQNYVEIQMVGSLEPEQSGRPERTFLTRSAIRLPVGWECLEVYPYCTADDWQPEFAHAWAESDVLALSLMRQQRELYFRSLDPKAEARKQLGLLLSHFKSLLDSNPQHEQVLQTFLQDHPALLCPGFAEMWPKLPLGARQTDFVFRDARNEYLLVELEKSTHRLFRKDGHASSALTHAHGQILDWKRYLEDNLATVQRELGLVGISTNPKSLVVIGRSKSLTKDHRRKLTTMGIDSPMVQVWTYDDVYENAKATIENLLGPIWETTGNTHIYFL